MIILDEPVQYNKRMCKLMVPAFVVLCVGKWTFSSTSARFNSCGAAQILQN
jgi:hypothetical protein